MATLWVYELDATGYPGKDATPIANAAANGRTTATPVTSGSLQSDPFLQGTRMVGLQSDLACWVNFGANPTAAVGTGVRIGKDQLPRVFGVYPNQIAAVIAE